MPKLLWRDAEDLVQYGSQEQARQRQALGFRGGMADSFLSIAGHPKNESVLNFRSDANSSPPPELPNDIGTLRQRSELSIRIIPYASLTCI